MIYIDENIIYYLLFALTITLGWMTLSMIFAFQYTLNAIWSNITGRPMGAVINNNGILKWRTLTSEKRSGEEHLTDKKLGSWRTSEYSLLRPPMAKLYILLTNLDLTIPPKLAYETTQLTHMGYPDIKTAYDDLYDQIYSALKKKKYGEGEPKTNEDIIALSNQAEAAKNSILERGGIRGDPFTVRLGNVHRFYLSNSNPIRTKNIAESHAAEVKLEAIDMMYKNIKPSKLFDQIVTATIIVMVAIILGYVALTLFGNVNQPHTTTAAATTTTTLIGILGVGV
jgi:hypothetical protein